MLLIAQATRGRMTKLEGVGLSDLVFSAAKPPIQGSRVQPFVFLPLLCNIIYFDLNSYNMM